MQRIIVQRTVSDISIPRTPQLKHWAKAVLQEKKINAEVTLRIVSKEEIQELNATYRHKNKPTNVLSFPFDMPADINETPILGDIVLCADVIKDEAQEQHKSAEAHWAHMVVHGLLHLLGYDHVKDDEADIMEAEEIELLKNLGFKNPYEISRCNHE